MALGIITEADKATLQAALDSIVSGSAVKVDAGKMRSDVQALRDKGIAAGRTLLAVATLCGHTTVGKKGKVAAHGSLSRPWRLAEYLHKAQGHASITATLETGYSLTQEALGKMLRKQQAVLVEAGLLDRKAKAGESLAMRAGKAVTRAVKRFKAWTSKGIPAGVGATADVPPFDAENMVRQALDGATLDILAAYCQRVWDSKAPLAGPGATVPLAVVEASSPEPVQPEAAKATGKRNRKRTEVAA